VLRVHLAHFLCIVSVQCPPELLFLNAIIG
jgi:hypothetical protein